MRQIIILTFAVLLLGCRQISSEQISYEKTWVYIHLEIKTKIDTTNYYYYGKINQRILDKLTYSENYKSLFVLTDVRYYNDLDELQEYEDESDEGILFFRTEDIIKIDVLKDDPLLDKNLNMGNDSLK
jgi:hypothetical protein